MKSQKWPKSEAVSVGANLRRAHAWLEALAERVKRSAVEERRKAERGNGPWLPQEQIAALVDELEQVQQALNPLLLRRKEIAETLVAHWGHTGVEELEGVLGRALISTSFELGLDEAKVKEAVDPALWQRVTRRVLSPAHVLAQATTTKLRDAINGALCVRSVKVSVLPPSSRRPKGAEVQLTSEEIL